MDGLIPITNKKTGEKKYIRADEAQQYGLRPEDLAKYKPTPAPQQQIPRDGIVPASSVIPNQDPRQAMTQLATEQTAPPQPQGKSLSGFINNLGSSGFNAIKDVASAVFNVANPNMEENTVANLVRIPFGVGELLAQKATGKNPNYTDGNMERAKAVGNFYKDRYGGGQNILDTLYEDPVGAALDASVVLGGGGAALKGAGGVSKASKVARAGELASKAGQMIDPIQQVGKLAKKATAGGAGKGAQIVEDVGKEAAAHGLRANNSQFGNFESMTGRALEDFITENKLFGGGKVAAEKAEELIKPLQDQYNSMVRSGTKIEAAPYVQALKQKAAEIKQADFSPEGQKVAQALEERAMLFENEAAKTNGIIDVDVLTNTKSSQFSEVPQGAMMDPSAAHAGKLAGGIGLDLLEGIAPGSSQIGKRLQELRLFVDIAKKQSNLGKGSQVFNLLKPTGGGAAIGATLGTALGSPLLGTAAGAVIGGMASNPAVLGKISQATGALSKAMPGVESGLSSVAGKAETVGKNASAVVQPDSSNEQQNTNNLESLNHNDNSIQQPVNQGGLPPAKDGQLPSLTKFTPQQLYKGYLKAQAAGNKAAAAMLRNMYEDEMAFQDMQIKRQKDLEPSEDDQTRQQLNNTIDEMSKLYGTGTNNSLSAGDTTVGISGLMAKGSQKYKKTMDQGFNDRLTAYGQMRSIAAGIINKARQAGTLNSGEYEVMIQNMPDENSSEAQAKAWFENAKRLLQNMPASSGLPDNPPAL